MKNQKSQSNQKQREGNRVFMMVFSNETFKSCFRRGPLFNYQLNAKIKLKEVFTYPMHPSVVYRKFPGCGSACNNPVSSSCTNVASTPLLTLKSQTHKIILLSVSPDDYLKMLGTVTKNISSIR